MNGPPGTTVVRLRVGFRGRCPPRACACKTDHSPGSHGCALARREAEGSCLAGRDRRSPREQRRISRDFVSAVRFSGGHRARPVGPWANGRRQGVPNFVSVAPLAPGGVSARLGAKGRGVVARRLRVTRPAGVVDATCRPDTLDETEDMEVRREHRTKAPV